MVHKLLCITSSGGTMMRISVGVAPGGVARDVLGPSDVGVGCAVCDVHVGTARHVRQRDEEAEAALQRVDE